MRCAFSLCVLAILVVAAACNPKELPMPADTPSRIVLIGELVAGDSTHIRVGRSRSLSYDKHLRPEQETAIQVSCSEGGNALPLSSYDDPLLQRLFTTLFSNSAVVRPQTTYLIKATGPGLPAVEAPVQVPPAFSGSVTAAGPVLHNNDSMLAFDLRFAGIPGGTRYVVEALRSPVDILAWFFYNGRSWDYISERRLYDSLAGVGLQLPVRRDTTYSSQLERQVFFADRNSDENTAAGMRRAQYWLFVKPQRPDLAFRIFIPKTAGRHLRYTIQLKSIAPDYYDFLKDYELSHYQPTHDTSAPISPTISNGNVKGGLGVVGGVYLQEARFLY